MASQVPALPTPAPLAVGHRTKQEFVYRTLRNAILRCELQPGERLIIDDLAVHLKVSTIPVREALQTLQSESLVISVPHVGVTVAPISRQSIEDVFSVLEGLQTVAARLIVERANPTDLATLQRLVDQMDTAAGSHAHEAWADLNTEFHLTIGRQPDLALLGEATARALDLWSRIRRFYFKGLHRIEQAQREHRAIVEAMRARDQAAVEQLIREHNRGALAAYMQLHGRPPGGR